MSLSIASSAQSAAKHTTPCAVVGLFENKVLSPSAKALDQASAHFISQILKQGDITGKLGETLLLNHVPHQSAERILLVGCGKKEELGGSQFCTLLQAAAKAVTTFNLTNAAVYLTELDVKQRDTAWQITQTILLFEAACYRFNTYKTAPDLVVPRLKKLDVFTEKQSPKTIQTTIQQAQAIADGMALTKNLGNTPCNVCTPSYLASEAQKLAKKHAAIHCRVYSEKEMKKMGMGALLAVGQGSKQPPRLITLEYKGGAKTEKPIVLVGKGITFDTGGISLKAGPGMEDMKFDMLGAATVLGTLQAIAQMKLKINVVGVIPTAENMPDGNAYRPGDILKSLSGQTIEVQNTDAEGRLILCDALTFAERFHPDAIIDIATLTGACIIALGYLASGLMSRHDDLANDLLKAGEQIMDRAWRLPLWDEYDQLLESAFADMKNVGGRPAGTITAGCFLGRFTKSMKWAHLDIAGTGMPHEDVKFATGRPVTLLSQYLINRAKK